MAITTSAQGETHTPWCQAGALSQDFEATSREWDDTVAPAQRGDNRELRIRGVEDGGRDTETNLGRRKGKLVLSRTG